MRLEAGVTRLEDRGLRLEAGATRIEDRGLRRDLRPREKENAAVGLKRPKAMAETRERYKSNRYFRITLKVKRRLDPRHRHTIFYERWNEILDNLC